MSYNIIWINELGGLLCRYTQEITDYIEKLLVVRGMTTNDATHFNVACSEVRDFPVLSAHAPAATEPFDGWDVEQQSARVPSRGDRACTHSLAHARKMEYG